MKRNITPERVQLIALFFVAVFAIQKVVAQTNQPVPDFCGSDFMVEKQYQQNPGLQQETAAAESRMREEGKRNLEDERSASPPTYTIPVVFHVIHDYGIENISDAQILDALAIMNRGFRKLNADTSQIVPPFDTLAADCEIEFRLAQSDPNGNCTNGIDRIASMETYVGDDGSKLNQWSRDKYLNIWVVKQILFNNIAGYAYTPSTVSAALAPYDDVLMLHDYIGSIGTGSVSTSRILVHELGHWFGLSHLGFLCADSDGIADTPITSGWNMCQLANNDLCNPGTPENVQNFMEFSYCQRMFTRGQRDAMHIVLNSSVSDRNNLWTNGNLSATGVANTPVTCAPHADFEVNRRMLCKGIPITFTDASWSSAASSWQWTLAGPVTLNSAGQNPVFTMNTAGSYDATLIATNSAGSDTITKPDFIVVSSDTATLNGLYSEGFENPNTFATLGYITLDGYGNGSVFSQSDSVGHTGSGSAHLNNSFNNMHGDKDELITPSYYLSYNTGMQIQFVYAYAADDTTGTDDQALKLWTSNNCGQTWIVRWSRSGTILETVSPVPVGPFIPTLNSQWDTITVNLPASAAIDHVLFKFEFTSPDDGKAKDLYIDDINILSTNVGIHENTNTNSLTVYPNPGDGNSTIAYTLTEAADVQYTIYDVSGRLINSVNQGQQAPGNYFLLMNTALAPGTYFIEVKIGDTVSVQKYLVTE